ncbi:MAG: YbaN family protein [Bradyrhizobium sp.]|nr:YbaN family protein [Bradyrhizobium sp.]
MRIFYFCLGWVLVALGVIGAVTPLLPTTIFLIGAAGCFARSSPRLEAWLLDHPRFGKPLRDWRSAGAISRPAKITACAGMTFGFVVFWFSAHPSMPAAAGVATVLLASAAYVVSRPTIVDQP